MRNPKDISNEKFGTLTPVEIVGRKSGRALWKCVCDCGETKNATQGDLHSGNISSCGKCQRTTLKRDLLGCRFGKLVVIDKADNIGTKTAWLCKCDCGQRKAIKTANLVKGGANSCGCQVNYNKSNLIGKTFGRLTVISVLGVSNKHKHYLCRCSCGKEACVDGGNLSKGHTKSCGCLRQQLASIKAKLKLAEKNPAWRGGASLSERTTPEYEEWRQNVLRRDSYCCQVCADSKDLEVHHLNAFASFPEQRNDVNNGICLCWTCHKLFHMECGSGDNTAQQFEMWRAKIIGGEAPSV